MWNKGTACQFQESGGIEPKSDMLRRRPEPFVRGKGAFELGEAIQMDKVKGFLTLRIPSAEWNLTRKNIYPIQIPVLESIDPKVKNDLQMILHFFKILWIGCKGRCSLFLSLINRNLSNTICIEVIRHAYLSLCNNGLIACNSILRERICNGILIKTEG